MQTHVLVFKQAQAEISLAIHDAVHAHVPAVGEELTVTDGSGTSLRGHVERVATAIEFQRNTSSGPVTYRTEILLSDPMVPSAGLVAELAAESEQTL